MSWSSEKNNLGNRARHIPGTCLPIGSHFPQSSTNLSRRESSGVSLFPSVDKAEELLLAVAASDKMGLE